MKIYAIKDDTDQEKRALAYLIYYENEKKFFIELPDGATEWDVPLILSSFAKKGEYTINSYWSKQWILQRIIPAERQNITQILKANGLKEYDEMDMLLLSKGRCEQDTYYLEQIKNLPSEYENRLNSKVEDVVPLSNQHLLVFFKNGKIKKYNASDIIENKREFLPIKNHTDFFINVEVGTGGHCVCWDENCYITNDELYSKGETVPLSASDFTTFVKERTLTTSEVCQELNCSRQNLNELVIKDKLHPVKSTGKTTLFMKSEIEQRKW